MERRMISYKEFEKLMEGCHSPDKHEALKKYANTPEFIRRLCVYAEKEDDVSLKFQPYHLGFWNWCKENHIEILKEFRDEMKQGIEELKKMFDIVLCPECHAEISITNSESVMCPKCGFWENSLGESGHI